MALYWKMVRGSVDVHLSGELSEAWISVSVTSLPANICQTVQFCVLHISRGDRKLNNRKQKSLRTGQQKTLGKEKQKTLQRKTEH